MKLLILLAVILAAIPTYAQQLAKVRTTAGVPTACSPQNFLTIDTADNALYILGGDGLCHNVGAGGSGTVTSVGALTGVFSTATATTTPAFSLVAHVNLTAATDVSLPPLVGTFNFSGLTTKTGVWAAANGGTGQSSYTKGDLLVTPGGTTINKLAVGTDGQVLTADAASTNGVKWAAAGGTGTVTVVGSGSLTSTALVTGGGTTTVQTPAPTATMDSSGNISTPGTISIGVGGSTAGTVVLTQGTAPSGAAATTIQIHAPTSVTTAYDWILPAADATGFLKITDSANVGTISIDGTVVTSASTFANGGLVKAAGANRTLASADLTGDATTSGGVAVSLAAPFKKRSCEIVWGGSGTAFALTSGDDAVANNSCYNKIGVTETITAVYCRSDAGSNTTTINPTFGAAGTGTTIMSGAITCGSSNAYSTMSTGCGGGACTVSNGALTDGTGITPVMGGTLTGTSIHVLVVYTVPNS